MPQSFCTWKTRVLGLYLAALTIPWLGEAPGRESMPPQPFWHDLRMDRTGSSNQRKPLGKEIKVLAIGNWAAMLYNGDSQESVAVHDSIYKTVYVGGRFLGQRACIYSNYEILSNSFLNRCTNLRSTSSVGEFSQPCQHFTFKPFWWMCNVFNL